MQRMRLAGGGSMAQGAEAVAGAGEAIGTPVQSVVGAHLRLCHLTAIKKSGSVSRLGGNGNNVAEHRWSAGLVSAISSESSSQR